MIDPPNDTTSFRDKEATANGAVDRLHEKILQINISYASVNADLRNTVSAVVEGIDTVPEHELVIQWHRLASPVISSALISEEIVKLIKRDLYAGYSLLELINNTYIPNVTLYASVILNNTLIAQEERLFALTLQGNLQIQLVNVTLQAAKAINQTNTIQSVAGDIMRVFNSSWSEVYQLEDNIESLISTINDASDNLMELQLMMNNKRTAVNETIRLLQSLSLPEEDDIYSIINRTHNLTQYQRYLNSEILTGEALLLSLVSDLSNYTNTFNDLYTRLNETRLIIDEYHSSLYSKYTEAVASASSAAQCTTTSDNVLSQLIAFNTSIATLRDTTDNILSMVYMIQEEAVSVMNTVTNASMLLNTLTTRLVQANGDTMELINTVKQYEVVSYVNIDASALCNLILVTINGYYSLL